MLERLSAKHLIIISQSVLAFSLLAGISAAAGSSWSIQRQTGRNGITVGMTFGLSEFTTVADGITTSGFYADLANDPTTSRELAVDYNQMSAAGRSTSTFLAFAIIGCIVSIVLHALVWPVAAFPKYQRLAPLSTFITSLCFLLTFFLWAAIGHTASRHVAVDTYLSMPQAWHGWCFDVMVMSFLFTLLAAASTSRKAVQMAQGAHVGFHDYSTYSSPADHDEATFHSAPVVESRANYDTI